MKPFNRSVKNLKSQPHFNMSEVKNIPRLRFSEFKNNWSKKYLKSISKVKGRIGFRGYTKSDLVEECSGALVLGGKNISNYRLDLSDRTYLNWDKYHESPEIKLNTEDILLSQRGTLGDVAIIDKLIGHSTINPSMVVLKEININPFFLFFQLCAEGIQTTIKRVTTSTAVPMISQKQIGEFIINVPSLPEQQKIADFLTAADKRIELLEKKKTLLETYKKGVMKKIFNQEIRFKDDSGNDFPDWEEKKLGEIGDIVTGKTPSTSNKSYWNGQIQFITPTDIHSGIKYQRDTTRTVTEFKGIKILPVGSIVYTCIASIGKMAITKNPSITNQQINSIITKDINTEFLYYSLQYLTPRIQSLKSTTTLPIINKTEFTGFKIHCPAIIEQVKISKFLSSIDTQLELLETQIDKSKTWKKGLLQKMFV